MYNLDVVGNDNFFVGEKGWLVHNSVCLTDIVRYKINPSITPWGGSRQSAIKRAWDQEQQLVLKTGLGSQNWSTAELKELATTGKISGYTGHHINNVATSPAWQGDPRNIVFLTNRTGGRPNEHLYGLEGHRGAFTNSTSGRLVDRLATMQMRLNP